MPTGEVVVTVVVTMTVERAFSAFTDDIDRWWRRTPGEAVDAVVRFEQDRLVAVSPGGAEVVATVAEWSPPRHLALDWQGPHAEAGDRVWVDFAPEAEGTRVTIRHQRANLSSGATAAAIIGLWWGDVLHRLAHRPPVPPR